MDEVYTCAELSIWIVGSSAIQIAGATRHILVMIKYESHLYFFKPIWEGGKKSHVRMLASPHQGCGTWVNGSLKFGLAGLWPLFVDLIFYFSTFKFVDSSPKLLSRDHDMTSC